MAFGTMGERASDPDILQKAMIAHRATLTVDIQEQSIGLKFKWNNLGSALQALGEHTGSAEALQEDEDEDALTEALTLKDKSADPLDWATTQNNLALAQRWLGAATDNLTKLNQARQGYAACKDIIDLKDKAAFRWARLQWNIADLALARFQLDPDPAHLVEARTYLAKARTFFVDGSEYQTQRCDELLAEIDAAEAANP
ncbi:MAG: hypothetical protein KJP02_09005 [Octadecabacter sp.]|nr:hypothetical protein [Octadecabacter sp.]